VQSSHYPPAVSATSKRQVALGLLLVLLALAPPPPSAQAYVYPEHRRVTVIAIRGLESTRRAQLDGLWALARSGYESRLGPSPVDTSYTPRVATIDFAAWPAVAGDHSCSASEMLGTVTTAEWIVGVHAVGAALEQRLLEAGAEKFKRTNALRDADLRLLTVDPEYATRAGANNVHFLLPRPAPDTELRAYIAGCLKAGAPLNAVGVYARHHARALTQAELLASGTVPEAGRAALVRAMLADEAFGIHFLEDAFAAGHVAGSWGDAALRKGTHDYYNEHGIAVTTWNGESFVIMGDAWMRDEDGRRAGRIVRMSLEQLLDAALGVAQDIPHVPAANVGANTDTLNVCKNDSIPDTDRVDEFLGVIARVIGNTPVPGLDVGVGELPRFRSELGPFIGISSAVRTAWHRGGFLASQQGSGITTGIEVAARFGIGLEGVMNESGDGLAFLDIGWARDGASSLKISGEAGVEEFGAITAVIPSRSAFFGRLRVPFWILPFDLLIAGPILAVASPETFVKMGIVATNGGLVGWQSGIATSFGRFQFILGREINIALYGRERDGNRVLAYDGTGPAAVLHLLEIRSVQISFPILDYRNFRTFSRDQSSGMHIQIFGGVDIPERVRVIEPATASPGEYGPIWFLGLRASLDWRYYF
jgi:hypothetical protein